MPTPWALYLSPVTRLFWKPMCACLALSLPATHPFPKLAWPSLQGYALYSPWFPWKQNHCFKPFDEMIDSNYLSLIVFLFVLLLVFMLQFGKKDKKLEQSPLRIITSQRWNRKWGDLLHPRFFKIWIWWPINKKFNTIRRCACRSPFAYFFFFLDFGFGCYLIERGGCT